VKLNNINNIDNNNIMCKPSTREIKRVVISGAGPAGLLCASILLARNKEQEVSTSSEAPIYHVTLIDGRQDFGALTKEELAKSFRSWMLGLANHGLDALRTIPDLYENYVKKEGVVLEDFSIYLGKKCIKSTTDDGVDDTQEGRIVDRNYIVAAIARYLKDTHENDTEHYTSMYDTTTQYVDYANKRVLVRNLKTQDEEYVNYDLLIGCDGVRSTVREAMIKRHSSFECHITDIFQKFKAVHVQRPDALSAVGMSILPDIIPGFQGIALPETGDLVNISMGIPHHRFSEMHADLQSEDYKVVSKYFKDNFKAFELVDYDDFAKQWVAQRWNQTGMVHCNSYHSSQMGIVLMGDAAHATSPSIGMGMNTALRDAQFFCNILKENNHDLEKVLPAYSEARVKEGNSLTSLAFNLYCLDSRAQTLETVHLVVRSFFHKKFPRFVSMHPQMMIGARNVALSDVFELATKLGIIGKHRSINDKIRNDYFEKSVGMVKENHGKQRSWTSFLLSVGVCAAVLVAAVFYQKGFIKIC